MSSPSTLVRCAVPPKTQRAGARLGLRIKFTVFLHYLRSSHLSSSQLLRCCIAAQRPPRMRATYRDMTDSSHWRHSVYVEECVRCRPDSRLGCVAATLARAVMHIGILVTAP